MKALFRGNLSKGMKLIGVYALGDCEKVAEYVALAFPEAGHLLDNQREYIQFIDIDTRAVVSGYGENDPEALTILASGSLTRGVNTIGPYPNRNAALSNAVALNFGNRNTGYFAVELAPEYQPLRQAIQHMLESHLALI